MYARCLLPEFAAGVYEEERLFLRGEDFYKGLGAEAHLGSRIAWVDPVGRTVRAEDGAVYPYDRLLIATGAAPWQPAVPGLRQAAAEGIAIPLQTLKDAHLIRRRLAQAERAVVVGAGFVGLEAAFNLAKKLEDVVLIERCERILPGQLDRTAARILEGELARVGVQLLLGEALVEMVPAPPRGHAAALALGSGRRLEADLVVLATGSRPNLDAVRDAGIRTHRGILVDRSLRTSAEDIYAAGDVAETIDSAVGHSFLTPIWPSAVSQGEIAATNMCGLRGEVSGWIGLENVAEFREVPVVSMGLVDPEGTGYEEYVDHRPREGVYRKVVVKDDRLAGLLFVGEIQTPASSAI